MAFPVTVMEPGARLLFQWAPFGFSRDGALEVVAALPFGEMGAELLGAGIGNWFVNYTPDVYIITLDVAMSDGRGVMLDDEFYDWLEGLADRLFGEFGDLMRVSFFLGPDAEPLTARADAESPWFVLFSRRE